MRKIIWIALFGFALWNFPLSAQRIMSFDDRVNVLESASEVLERPALSLGLIASDHSPFSEFKNLSKSLDETKSKEVEEIPETIRLSDYSALLVIAEQFKPVGSLVMGNRGILQFGNGSTMKLNDQFTARIKGEAYTVTISQVTTAGYELSLGEAKIQGDFLKNTLRESSTINRNP